MADQTYVTTSIPLFGRRKILIAEQEITRANVVTVMSEVLKTHVLNYKEENYLYWYRKGKQPILDKEKVVRPEINNMVVENHAAEIVAFKNGYFLAAPACYRPKKGRKTGVETKVIELNEYLYLSGKHDADNEVVDWFHTVGVGCLLVEPDEDTYVSVNALDPRYAAVAYYNNPKKTPALGFRVAQVGENIVYEVYTNEKIFRISGGNANQTYQNGTFNINSNSKVEEEVNRIGLIPMVEYRYNSADMGAFESVISLLDAINNAQSNRMDAVQQFVNSLLVFYNCTLGEDEEGNPITVDYIREVGAVFLKSVGENKADIKELSSQLNQTDQQVMVNYLYDQVLRIVGMPTTTKGGTSTSDTGTAVLLRDGWEHADACARNTEDLFKKSNRQFDKIFLRILEKSRRFKINTEDFELHFPRTETMNLYTKTQAALNLKTLGFSPELVLAKSGISNDAVTDVANSQPYMERAYTETEGNTNGNEAE